jgi:acetylornithine/succinyldiaminopimelate/putrescine aminotransferase
VSEELESILGGVPGPRSRDLAKALKSYESRGVTYVADDFPIFWETAHDALVTDVDGNRFIDLTSAFGVATLGHTSPEVVDAIAAQARRLIHGLGDVHPSRVRVALLEKLAALAPAALEKSFLCSSGSEAVDFALKTAYLRTKRAGIVAFAGSYHGLASSALSVTGIERFREPFAPFVRDGVTFAPFGDTETVESALRGGSRTVIVEPIQGRAGVIVPPPGWLGGLRSLCDRYDAVLIFDEIYTGFGRTGTMFACEGEAVVPDLLCVGKAIAGGVPLAAVIGKRDVMDAWEASRGEALHTSTYLGNPLACAAALANLTEIERRNVPAMAAQAGERLGARLQRLRGERAVADVRGKGMLWAIELESASQSLRVTKEALRRGTIVLPSGVDGNCLTIAPPVTISEGQLTRAVDLLEEAMRIVISTKQQ